MCIGSCAAGDYGWANPSRDRTACTWQAGLEMRKFLGFEVSWYNFLGFVIGTFLAIATLYVIVRFELYCC